VAVLFLVSLLVTLSITVWTLVWPLPFMVDLFELVELPVDFRLYLLAGVAASALLSYTYERIVVVWNVKKRLMAFLRRRHAAPRTRALAYYSEAPAPSPAYSVESPLASPACCRTQPRPPKKGYHAILAHLVRPWGVRLRGIVGGGASPSVGGVLQGSSRPALSLGLWAVWNDLQRRMQAQRGQV